jgi:hypothetical protein
MFLNCAIKESQLEYWCKTEFIKYLKREENLDIVKTFNEKRMFEAEKEHIIGGGSLISENHRRYYKILEEHFFLNTKLLKKYKFNISNITYSVNGKLKKIKKVYMSDMKLPSIFNVKEGQTYNINFRNKSIQHKIIKEETYEKIFEFNEVEKQKIKNFFIQAKSMLRFHNFLKDPNFFFVIYLPDNQDGNKKLLIHWFEISRILELFLMLY